MNLPLMRNNITEEDADVLVEFLSRRPLPILTNGPEVRKFEQQWSQWLGVKHSVFVNSGNSANVITLALMKYRYNWPSDSEVLVAPLGWISDVSSILYAGYNPVFCDIDIKNLAISETEIKKRLTPNTRAIILTHILGYNGLTQGILDLCEEKNIVLIEDCCESHGATFKSQKVGSFGDVSNFSFYYAHHMTTIEGGMICTNDSELYDWARLFRSHGMIREMDDKDRMERIVKQFPELNEKFIFTVPGFNMRSTEINAVLGQTQLKRLDENILKRRKNLDIFLDALNPQKYYTLFNREGNSNYAFTLLLRDEYTKMRDEVEKELTFNGIEFRRGMSGGGNQYLQPYLRPPMFNPDRYPLTDYVHKYGWYIGNFPELQESEIIWLTEILNSI
jgi:CDP-4-dehydro-6-deoxyglucose reductase, E1